MAFALISVFIFTSRLDAVLAARSDLDAARSLIPVSTCLFREMTLLQGPMRRRQAMGRRSGGLLCRV